MLDNQIWDYLNKLVCTPVSTDNAEAVPGLRVWPNPATDGWNLQADVAIERAELYASDGRRVRVFEGTGVSNLRLDAVGLPAGVYGLRVFSGDKSSFNQSSFRKLIPLINPQTDEHHPRF